LTAAEAERVQAQRRSGATPRLREWADILWLLHLGQRVPQVMQIAGVSRRTVERARQRWRLEGLEGLLADRQYRPVSELDQHNDAVRAAFEAQPPRTVGEAAQRIAELTGVTRSHEQVRLYLHRLGMSFRQVAAIPVPPKKVFRNMSPTSSSS
jgi:transposase